jgi:UDP-glucose 4-epimerase
MADARPKPKPKSQTKAQSKPRPKPRPKPKPKKLKVAVTGPTGDIGIAALKALDASPKVGEIVGMARRPFDPASHGLKKVTYQQGDVLDRKAVEELCAGADVVMHLAFIIFGDPDEAQKINLEGSRNVFEAAVGAKAKRLVYTSSVAAYGFHSDNPQPLHEDVEPRGTDSFYYSAHKAELEALLDEVAGPTSTDTYVFRPCIVAGPEAPTLIETMVNTLPVYGQVPALRRIIGEIPFLAPVLPDPGMPFQLVHHDDVADALVAAAEGRGEPGRYNLAADGEMTVATLARALGWWSVPVPGGALGPLDGLLSRVPGLPAEVAWLTTFRVPVVMDTARAADQLGWKPSYDAEQTLAATVDELRDQGRL